MKHGLGENCALALVLALSACGGSDGGGGGSVNSTPPPAATYKTLDQLSGSQTFQTAGVNVPLGTSDGTTAKTYKFGSGITLAYDAPSDSYTLTSPDGYGVTMTQLEYDATHSTSTTSVYARSAGATQDRVVLSRPIVNGTALSYTLFGTWAHIPNVSDQSSARTGLAIGGVPTIASDIPTSGTASYSTFVGGSMVGYGSGTVLPTGTPYPLYNQSTGEDYSSATFSINFATGLVDTGLNLKGMAPGSSTITDFGSFTGSGSLASGSPAFSGTLAGNSATGAFSGALFGPQGKEMGYAWYLFAPTFEGRGVVLGIKK